MAQRKNAVRAAPASEQAPDVARPRREFLLAAGVYLVLVLALAYPALAGAFLVGPHSDQYIAGYAFREFAASYLREFGSIPQWNPYLFGGMPYVAAMHGDTFYPTFLLRLLLPTDVAMTWAFITHVVLAALFAFGFFRAARISFAAALVGGLAYGFGGQLASLVSPGHDGKLFVSALFPLALWLLLLWIRDARAWAPALLALIVGLAVLSPHPQLFQYFLLGAGAYALYLGVRGIRTAVLTARVATVRLAVSLGAVLLGALIGAVQFLPVRQYVAWSPRAGGVRDYATATSFAWPPVELLDVYLPQFSGILDAYWGQNLLHFHSQYVGASVLLLAFAAFVGLRRDSRRGEILFWTGALVVALLWAFGGHTPFYRLPYAIVPGTKFFRAPATVFFIGALALSFLAAVGTERVLRGDVGRRYVVGWGIATLVLALLASVGALTGLAESFAAPEMYTLVRENHAAVVMGAWRSFAVVALLAALVVSFAIGRLRAPVVAWAIAAIVAADLWSVMRHYWLFSPPAAQLYASDPTIEYLRRVEQPARVLALQLAPDAVGRDASLVGDGLMVHRVRTVLGYHGNQLARYNILAGKDQGFNQIANPAFWRLSNAQFLLSNVDSLPLVGAERVAGPARTAAGTRVSLFRLPGEQPYAWLTPLIVRAPDDAVLGTVLDPRFDPRTAALFDTSAGVRAIENVRALPPPLAIGARVTGYRAGRVSIALSAPTPVGAALVVSENFYPGWRALVDGRAAAVGRVNYSFLGVELPTGARTVELTFHDEAYARGKIFTLAALAAALLWLAGAAIVGRRRAHA